MSLSRRRRREEKEAEDEVEDEDEDEDEDKDEDEEEDEADNDVEWEKAAAPNVPKKVEAKEEDIGPNFPRSMLEKKIPLVSSQFSSHTCR